MSSSKLETILASLSAILAYRSRVQGSHQTSNGRSTDREDEPNTYGLPDGELIAEELTRWYRRQRKAVLMEIPKPSELLPLILPLHLTSLASRSWIDPMARSMIPRLTPIWEDSYRTSKGRLERTRAIAGGVSNPHLRAAIERQAFAFCRATNESTSKRLETALDDLKHALAKGLIDRSESIDELKDRVNEIFDGLEEHQARRIAATEASRALHAAQEMAAIESGVVAGKELLISADACELCQMVATEAKRVRIGQAFAIIGNHPEYQTIEMPPIHPNCRCTAIDILMPEYGGPAEVDWASTLIQPQERLGEEYIPPPGKEVPQPEPERIKEEPKAVKVLAPSGIPVGNALTLPEGDFGDQLRATIDAINSVHGDGELPVIPIRATWNSGFNGLFYFTDYEGVKRGIDVDQMGRYPNLTLAHEVGHFLDHYGEIGSRESVRGDRPWVYDSVFKEWYDVVQNSEAIQRLSKLQTDSQSVINGETVEHPLKYIEYLLTPNEIWARSYAQYIATKSNNLAMKNELNEARRLRPGRLDIRNQWSDEDFAPIMKTIDQMFVKVGWIK